jgi:hypothetical protein
MTPGRRTQQNRITVMRTVPTDSAQKAAPSSKQVLDVTTGSRTNDFALLEKRDFRRAPWLMRTITQTLCCRAPRNTNRSLSKQERNAFIQEALDELKKLKNPSSYDEVLKPFFATAEKLCVTDHEQHLMKLFSSLLSLILESSADFLNQSHQREVGLGPRDHYRALTNYWVYLILGTIFDDTDVISCLSEGVYAYSFLYPYSDDLMDSANVDTEQKKLFCKNVASKILGRIIEQNAFESNSDDTILLSRERRVYELIDQALSNTKNNALRESLCVINHAQLSSIKQHVKCENVEHAVKSLSKQFEQNIFDVSVNKGVASVMPDTYFIVPNDGLTQEQAELAAMVGAMGQFINDVEGLFDDLDEKSLTPALISYLKHKTLDRFMEKSMTYIERQLRQASVQYSSLPQDRVELLLHIVKLRLLVAGVYLNDSNPDSHVLSRDFCCGVEKELGIEMSMLALLGRLEREIFGGNVEMDGNGTVNHYLSSPELFRRYILVEMEKLL